MKRFLITLFSSTLFVSMVWGQNLVSIPATFQPLEPLHQVRTLNTSSRVASCGPDTLQYAFLKIFEADSGGVQALGIGGAFSGIGQSFGVPMGATVTVSGFTFYGWSTAADDTDVSIRCQLFNADMTGLPTGTPLAEVTVDVDTTFGGGSLAVLQRHATFTTPVQVTQNFVVVTENLSDTTYAALSNDWNFDHGQQEGLSGALLNGAWLDAQQLGFPNNGPNLDVDFFIEPHVSYEIDVAFVADQECLVFDTPINFTGTVSPIVQSRFYNRIAFRSYFDMTPDSTSLWDLGDGNMAYGATATNSYSAASNSYTVKLFTGVLGYSTFCEDSTEMTFPAAMVPSANFTSSLDTATITASFTNSSSGADAYMWDFGDGNTSTDADPMHTYASGGVYTVSLIVTSCNGMLSDTITQTIGVATTSIFDEVVQNLQVYPNPSQGQLEVDLKLNQLQTVRLSFFNQLGQEVLVLPSERIQSKVYQVDLSAQEAGLYFLRVEVEGEAVVRKVSLF